MNTPRKKRRHSWSFDSEHLGKGGNYAFGLFNPDYAVCLASILTQFEHLESRMPAVLAMLLGMPDDRAAGYVYRAIRNPNIRHDVLVTLLEKAPHNVELGENYDEILAEYEALRTARNNYAHGLWFTETRTKEVLLARRDEHGFAFVEARPEPLEELQKVVEKIQALTMRVVRVASTDLAQFLRHGGNPPQSG